MTPNYTRNESSQIFRMNRPKSAPNRVLRVGFYTRRFGPYESTYIRRFENRDPGRLHGIRRKNRLKRFQIENDSQKGGTIPGGSRHRPVRPDVLLSLSTRCTDGGLRFLGSSACPAASPPHAFSCQRYGGRLTSRCSRFYPRSPSPGSTRSPPKPCSTVQ